MGKRVSNLAESQTIRGFVYPDEDLKPTNMSHKGVAS